MAITVERTTVVDRFHYNGDPYWDGDQTLYELRVADGQETADLLFVVARGDAFIAEEDVAHHVERLGTRVSELRRLARRPSPERRAQIPLALEPG